ncbi:hypothetical protein [Altericista sp. CCNU0014]|uniref:hypothetical protein n=1 Tax=Altericista sp. CCNU0014 TaxID=3082949 RepID=UPI00385135E0
MLAFFTRLWKKIFLYALLTISLILLQTIVFAQPPSSSPSPSPSPSPSVLPAPSSSGLPEETLVDFVTQISDGLATKIQSSTCPEAIALLDKMKEASAKAPDRDSLVGKVLLDVKTNPKLKDIIIQKVSAPMLGKVLECNMVPLDLAGPS